MCVGFVLLFTFVLVGPTERHHSLQVYSYHGEERTFKEMHTFFKGMGFQYQPLRTPMDGKTVFENIAQRSPDFIALSIDLECLQNTSDLEAMMKSYWPLFKPITGNKQQLTN